MLRAVATLCLLTMTALAGCGDSGGGGTAAGNEVIIESKPPEEINSNDTVDYRPSPKEKGHLAGVVVDQAIHPLEGATVKLPGMDLTEVTDRDGSFGFVDLYPGPYFITVELEGYYAAEAMLEVHPDEFTRAKVILEAIPPPDPRHETQQFQGFAQLGGDPLLGFTPYCSCNFDFYWDQLGLQALVVEAKMSNYGGAPGGSNSFYHYLDAYSGGRMSSGSLGNPMRLELREGILVDDSHYRLDITPEGFPVPEINKSFDVFVTAWYNSMPPAGWSFVAGDE